MQLGERLQAMAAFVPVGAKVADIGTDHAYLPIYLVKENIVGYAIAADIAEGPLNAARASIKAYCCEDKVETRLGDGLAVLAPGEVDTIMAAGMGGSTIAGVLADSPQVTDKAQRLILQPMGEAAALRRFLYAQGWEIKDETLVKEAGRLYQVIFAQKGESGQAFDDFILEAGPVLLVKRPMFFAEHLQNIAAKFANICANMEKSTQATASEKYGRSKKLLERAEELLTCLCR